MYNVQVWNWGIDRSLSVFFKENALKQCFCWDFPGGSVAKTWSSPCRGPGFDPWSGNKIPYATTLTWCRQKIHIYVYILKGSALELKMKKIPIFFKRKKERETADNLVVKAKGATLSCLFWESNWFRRLNYAYVKQRFWTIFWVTLTSLVSRRMTWSSHICDLKLILQCYFPFANWLDPLESNCALVDVIAAFGRVLSN